MLTEKLDSERSKACESMDPLAPKPPSSPICFDENLPDVLPSCPVYLLDLLARVPAAGSVTPGPRPGTLPSIVLLSENSKSIDCWLSAKLSAKFSGFRSARFWLVFLYWLNAAAFAGELW